MPAIGDRCNRYCNGLYGLKPKHDSPQPFQCAALHYGSSLQAAALCHLCLHLLPADSATPKAERGLTVLDAWTKAQRQLHRGMTMREIVREEFEDVYPGDVEQVGPVVASGTYLSRS